MFKVGNLALVAAVGLLAGTIPALAKTIEVAIIAKPKEEYQVSITGKINGLGQGNLTLRKASGQVESVLDGVDVKGSSTLQLEMPDNAPDFLFERIIQIDRDGVNGYVGFKAYRNQFKMGLLPKESNKKFNGTVAESSKTITLK